MDINILRQRSCPEKVPAPAPTDETPHACYDGWVYMGFEGEHQQGEHVELVERVPCRRCTNPENL